MLTAGSPRKTEITSSVPGLTDYMKGERAENPQMNYYRKKKPNQPEYFDPLFHLKC